MKLNMNFTFPSTGTESELVRSFGAAHLLRHASGHWELRGGTRSDRLEAREWISLFCHEAVVTCEAGSPAISRCPARPCRHAMATARE
jgi:hypothetical protein